MRLVSIYLRPRTKPPSLAPALFKIQHDLDNLVELASQSFGNTGHTAASPMIFFICTQGPFHELWAHYDSTKHDIRIFHILMVASCRAPMQREVVQWLMAVNNVMTWGSDKSLNGVVERLRMVAKWAARANN